MIIYPLIVMMEGSTIYVEARANVSLSEHLNKPDFSSMKMLLAGNPWFEPTPESCLAMIQETTVACGGFSIGVLVSHLIFYATALSFFLKD